jgi:hypothetical protein
MEFRVSADAPRRRRGIASSNANCGALFDLRKEPAEARGRHCSSTCLAARLKHHRHIRPGFDDLRARGADIRARPAPSG